MKKNIAILGSTGSVGRKAVEIVLEHPDFFNVVALSAHTNIALFREQVEQLQPAKICVSSESCADKFATLYPEYRDNLLVGTSGLEDIASFQEVELILIAIVGSHGLAPLAVALDHDKDIAFVNKESLVICGDLIMAKVKKHNLRFLPVDSEHSAIYQCLTGESHSDISQLILTASGGAFWNWTDKQKTSITPEMAIQHPCWDMGSKISIDSATLMNKGLEVIEAYHLFGLSLDKISIVVHRESIVHSMVEFVDGSIKAQLGVTDMKIPVAYALSFPQRLSLKKTRLNWKTLRQLTFEEVQIKSIPALDLCYQVCRLGGTYPLALNAANEVAVQAFLDGYIPFLDIIKVLRNILENHTDKNDLSIQDMMVLNREVQKTAAVWIEKEYSVKHSIVGGIK